jgi:hypothetical protein
VRAERKLLLLWAGGQGERARVDFQNHEPDVHRNEGQRGACPGVVTARGSRQPTSRSAQARLRLLLDSGTDYLLVVESNGASVLHYAALGGNVETMEVLAAHGVRGLDASLKDIAGLTARQCLENRLDVSEEP